MKLTHDELQFLSACGARNGSPRVITTCPPIVSNWPMACRVPNSSSLSKRGRKVKARRIMRFWPLPSTRTPTGPWATTGQIADRLAEASKRPTNLDRTTMAAELEVR